MILRKGRSLLFHCYQKQAYKIGDLNGTIAYERVTDRHTEQRTHGEIHGREENEGKKQKRDTQ